MTSTRCTATLLSVLVLVLSIGGAVSAVEPSASPEASPAPIVRSVLAAGQPLAAPGTNLELVRYTVQPGVALPAHRHPGMQIALVESGELTYTIIAGQVAINAPDGSTRTLAAGETGVVLPGEWFVEAEGVEHFGTNDGSQPLVILAASLLEADEPPAILLSPAPSPAS